MMTSEQTADNFLVVISTLRASELYRKLSIDLFESLDITIRTRVRVDQSQSIKSKIIFNYSSFEHSLSYSSEENESIHMCRSMLNDMQYYCSFFSS
jgi:hypothetical protein